MIHLTTNTVIHGVNNDPVYLQSEAFIEKLKGLKVFNENDGIGILPIKTPVYGKRKIEVKFVQHKKQENQPVQPTKPKRQKIEKKVNNARSFLAVENRPSSIILNGSK